ncbi:hypothetical protein ACQ4M3_39975 [Leptolyngbya sp. AN03gr2]|uniref:hypothetical protein n=1 Tax=unclassified Leptolyngbya TaxID=2650499 RepID=UPI003D31E8C3
MQSEWKLQVREFCETRFVDWCESGRRFIDWCELEGLAELYNTYLIASLELLGIVTSVGFDCVEIKRIEQEAPKRISDTFERHLWYSQYSLSDLYFLKIPIKGQFAFILLIRGFIDDGWDNSGSWIEVLDEQGKFLDSGRFGNGSIFWKSRPLNGEDFNSPAPPWINDETEFQIRRPAWADQVNPMWSEEILARYAISIEREGTKTRYFMAVD